MLSIEQNLKSNILLHDAVIKSTSLVVSVGEELVFLCLALEVFYSLIGVGEKKQLRLDHLKSFVKAQ